LYGDVGHDLSHILCS